MEEVDRIILINLKELGIGEDDDLKSLTDIAPQHVYHTALTYLNSLDDKPALDEYPTSLPPVMSQKVSLTSKLTNVLKQHGYKGDLSYHQILYPNPSDVRKLLMWFVDSMPKRAISGEEKQVDAAVDDLIKKELMVLLKESWTPHFASRNRKHAASTMSFHLAAFPIQYASRGRKLKQYPGLEEYFQQRLPLVSLQPPYARQLAPSIFEANLSVVTDLRESENEWNTRGLESGSSNPIVYKKKKAENIGKNMRAIMRKELNGLKDSGKFGDFGQQRKSAEGAFMRQNKFTTEEEVNINDVVKLSEEEMLKKREEELQELRQQLSTVQTENSELSSSIKSLLASIRQVENALRDEEGQTESLEN